MNSLNLRAAAVVAAVYGYFLLFAQFAFVELCRGRGIDGTQEKVVLGAMAVVGILSGFGAARRGADHVLIRISLVLAALGAGLATFASGLVVAIAVALMTGAALGVATVSLAALLRGWCGLPWIGLGTGVGYAICNLPVVFTATPSTQAWIAGGLAVLGAVVVPRKRAWTNESEESASKRISVSLAIGVFTALVWLDSAAFFIIQHNAELKSGTWGEGLLWKDAALHFVAAVVAGFWLMRAGRVVLPTVAWGALAVAGLAVNHAETIGLAGWLYPVGVSLYSTALVAWPGWFSGARGERQAGWHAAWLFGIAGWFGSANGIGMAQSLERVPSWFVLISGTVVIGGSLVFFRAHWRTLLILGAMGLVFVTTRPDQETRASSSAERGREVYISEGCIACHSQYLRPGSEDETLWGLASNEEQVLTGEPVLIGNRRNGPDLSTVGIRRSGAWLKAHFMNPQAFAEGSVMPSYAHLFEDKRGDDLVAYLSMLGMESMESHLAKIAAWEPELSLEVENGDALYARHCAVCHGEGGRSDGSQAGQFNRPPANLVAGPFIWSGEGNDQRTRVARIIKYGILGTDMPGHEVLTDAEISGLVKQVLKFRGEK